MFSSANRPKIESLCGQGLVLDVGGWADPFPRADYVLDCFTYETRRLAYHGIHQLPTSSLYPDPLPDERFRKNTWILHDICSSEPFPFPDQMFDFVICSHTLEDVRDPIKTCAELIRVSRGGYIETPSRLSEQTMGGQGMVGSAHHRWFVEMADNYIGFRFKPHFLHTHKAYYVPRRYLRRLGESASVSFLFWQECFRYEEIWGYEFFQEATEYVARLNIPRQDYWLDHWDAFKHQWRRRLKWKRSARVENAGRDLWTWPKLFAAAQPKK